MDAAQTAFLTAGITVALAGAVGYGLYRVVNVLEPRSPSDWGRRWLSWSLFLACISQLPSFFRQLDANSFAVWVLISVVLGVVGFSFGWLYGKFFKLRKHNRAPPGVAYSSSTGSNSDTEDQFYQVAWKELQVRRVNEGLWARAYAQAEGNKDRAKALYLDARATQLRDRDRHKKAEAQAEQRKEAVSKATTYTLNTIGRILFLALALFSVIGILSAVIMIVEVGPAGAIALIIWGPLAYWSIKRLIDG